MIRAIVRNGRLKALDPLPPEWKDGRELLVDDANGRPDPSPGEIDQWAQELEAAVAAIDPDDAQKMQEAIDEHRREAKEMMRREMGLP